MNNILFIIPHPDDEIVGASIIINRLLKKKNLFFFFLQIESFQKINNGIGIEMGTKRK